MLPTILRIHSRSVIGAIALGIIICGSLSFAQLLMNKSSTGAENKASYFNEFDTVRPVELLDKAKSTRHSPEFRTALVKNWITLNDVRELARRLDSTERCPHILSVLASDPADYYSTEGVQAAQMIYGYIKGVYPCNYTLGHEKEMVKDVRAWLVKEQIPID